MKRDCSFWKRRAYKECNVHSTDTPAWASSPSPTAPQVYGFPELVATSVLDNIVSEFRLLFQAISGGANRDAIDAVASAKPSLSLSLQLSSSRPRPDWWGRPKPSTDEYFKVWRGWNFCFCPVYIVVNVRPNCFNPDSPDCYSLKYK